MHLTLFPMRGLPGKPETTLTVAGDTITVDGVAYDLSPIPEGGEATPEGDHPFSGKITREGGTIHATVIVKLGDDALPHQPRDPAHWTVPSASGAIRQRGDHHPRRSQARTGGRRMTFSLSIKTADDLAAEAVEATRSAIRARRDVAIASGITVSGMPVQTDDLSQNRIVGAALAASLDATATVRWKIADGTFVTLDAPTIIAIAQAVRAHVQACFDHEATLVAALDAGDPVDIEAGWPGA